MLTRRKSKRTRTQRHSATELLEARTLLTGIELTAVGTYETGIFDESAAEIVAHDPQTQRAFFTNSDADTVDILDVSDPTNPTLFGSIDLTAFGSPNSVAVHDGLVAVAVESPIDTAPGVVAFFDADGTFLGETQAGVLPDSLTFSPDGNTVLVANEGEPDGIGSVPAMAFGENGFNVEPVFTIGESFSTTNAYGTPNTDTDYTPPGVLDGLGAMDHPGDPGLVRVFANHELLHFRGYDYELSDGAGGTYTMDGARISYFDIDKKTREVVDSGLAYNTIYDANGNVATDNTFLGTPFATAFGGSPASASQQIGFSRFCSSVLVEAEQFGAGNGLVDTIYFAGEEDGGGFNSIGGAEWALDVATGDMWQIPDMGRGAWENITEVDTGTTTHVAFILADDSSPFDVDDYDADQSSGDSDDEAAPLFLYVGEKDTSAGANFLERNGLSGGTLYVWVATDGTVNSPAEFNTGGSEAGSWVVIDNSPMVAMASQDGSTGFDEYGYPTQRTLWSRAETLNAFQFSRPEDVAQNPFNGSEFVMASTGVDTFDGGVDTFGTMYTMDVDFTGIATGTAPTGALNIIYDGDADLSRSLRSPDNLDWADDGLIYVQEDEAEEFSPTGEPLFGPGAANPKEAGIVSLDPTTGEIVRVATIDRSVVLDPTTAGLPVDTDAGRAGEWETSGILDVSSLFEEAPGTLFLFDIQAHGIEDQDDFNPDSRIHDNDLVEGGQLAFLEMSMVPAYDPLGSISIIDVSEGVGNLSTTHIGFTEFDAMKDDLKAAGVRLFPGKSVSQDVEPEYIAVAPDGLTAVVTLQEANAVAILDLQTQTITDIAPLGVKDHSAAGNGLDPSDRDSGINIASWPVFGLYMPDAITAFEIGGQTFYATANEGDDRGDADEDPWGDAVRLKDIDEAVSFNRGAGLTLDPSFPSDISDDDQLGRLAISTIDGVNADGVIEQIHSYGTRSFSIWDSSGNLVFDSGDDFEQVTAAAFPADFNSSNDENGDFEGRSDNKGPEPEAITTGVINGRTFAFIGLERIGGIMVYDVTDPANAEFISYVNNRDFSGDAAAGTAGDLGVEDLKFISAEDSPNGIPMILASNEVSGTVTAFQISGSIFNDGVLELIGTSDDDTVFFRRTRFNQVRVTANFLDTPELYPNSELEQIRVSTYAGNDRVASSSLVRTSQFVRLGEGDDTGIGGSGNDLILGEEGSDFITSRIGKDVLVGGEDSDTMIGSYFGGSLMIPGTTAFDGDNAALDLILGEWSSRQSFATRVSNLRNGTGSLVGTGVQLQGSGAEQTVFNDNASDTMSGRSLFRGRGRGRRLPSSQNWFFADQDGTGSNDDRIFGRSIFDELDLF